MTPFSVPKMLVFHPKLVVSIGKRNHLKKNDSGGQAMRPQMHQNEHKKLVFPVQLYIGGTVW